MAESETLRTWLRTEALSLLRIRATAPSPLVLWCDPEYGWQDLLKAAAEGGAFELWAEDEHELILRDRLLKSAPAPRVLWIPGAVDQISYLKVFELQAEAVWTEPLLSALARFGVEITRNHEAGLREMLRAYAVEQIDQPRSAWRDLTPGSAKSALVDDDQILAAIARIGTRISDIIGEERLSVFSRRVIEDFGLPAPAPGKDDEWRTAATARLLVTEAATRVPAEQPTADGDKTIPLGAARERALKLLYRWQSNIELMGAFEDVVHQADATTSLAHWARNLTGSVPALASRAAEHALFEKDVDDLARLVDFEPLASRLEEREPFYALHSRAFWGNRAEQRVPWPSLLTLSRAAVLIGQHSEVAKAWRTPSDAVGWFTGSGWEADRQGELLFKDDAGLPTGLHTIRARLRRAYLRHVDRCNAAFSELLHHHGLNALGLPFAGEVLAKARSSKDPMAVLVLDACRYDLGARIAEALDKGEPARRAEVLVARAPLPSVTALGMVFALADEPERLTVKLTDAPARWHVTAPDGTNDLTAADARRDWLRKRLKLKPGATTDVKSVLNTDPPTPKETGRLVFVFGDEFDVQGHEGELKFTGAEDHIERYVRVVRRLRDAGYPTIAIVTDHGFIHWEPDEDEVESLPSGEILWRSRRAVAGRGLKHPTALAAPVAGSDLEVRVPRSVNAFRTYGGLGYFHGGATLQELITPVVIFRWPKKAEKIAAVLTPISEIASVKPRVEVRPGTGQGTMFGADAKMVGRQVTVKVVEPGSGRRLFRSQSHKLDAEGQSVTIALEREPNEACARGARLQIELRDADNDELLDRCDAELKVDLEEWD